MSKPRILHKDGHIDTYSVLADNSRYTLYKCKINDENDYKIVMLSSSKTFNSVLHKQFIVLDRLEKEVNSLKYEYEENGHLIDYDVVFPHNVQLIEKFDDSGRSALVLKFHDWVDDFQDLVPLAKMLNNGFRVDLKTTAWIFGKLLKIISFAADAAEVEINDLSANNVLIHPEKHYVIVFDWSKSVDHEDLDDYGDLTKDGVRKAAQLAKRITSFRNGFNDIELVLVDFINNLSTSSMSAESAHKSFYGLVDSLCSNPSSGWTPSFHKCDFIKD